MNIDLIILAAGQGARMRPFSHLVSKPMLPIINKPVLQILIERFVDSNISINSIIIVVNPKNKDEIKSLINLIDIQIPVKIAIQDLQKGTADAISTGGRLGESEHIISIAGDSLFPTEFIKILVTSHLANQPNVKMTLALQKVKTQEISNFASVLLDNSKRILKIVEKPKPNEILSDFASLSFYIFQRSILKFFTSVPFSFRGELEAPDAFQLMLKNDFILKGCITNEYIHISNPKDIWLQNMKMLGRQNNLISSYASIQENSTIRKTIIGKNVKIGSKCKLTKCVILPNTIIPNNTDISKAVIGSSSAGLDIVEID